MLANLLLQLGGVLMLGVLAVEVFVTTLTMRGSGPLTGRVADACWRAFLSIHRGRSAHRLLAFGGGAIAVLTLALWILVLWAGWALIFAGAPDAVVDSSGRPADLWSRIYFAGFNIFTLGLGDFRPVGAAWQIATALSSASGLVAITLAISYLLPVLSQAVSRQALAAQIGLLGETPSDVARDAWRLGPDAFAGRLSGLAAGVLRQGRQHLAYPALHYFHASDPRFALPLRLAVLHEGLLMVAHGLRADDAHATSPACGDLLEAIGLFLDSIGDDVLGRVEDVPPPPSLSPLAAAGAPTTAQPRFAEALEPCRRRRRLLRGLVEHDGWRWEDLRA